MTLIVEDGTGISNADSYESVAGHIAYAALYGVTVSSQQAEINLRKGMDYIETDKLYKGCKEFGTDINLLQFPRTGIYINKVLVDSATSLVMIKKALNETALSIYNGVDPLAIKKKVVQSQELGPLKQTFDTKQINYPLNPRIDLFLGPLLKTNNSPLHFKVISDHNRHWADYYNDCD